MKIRSVITIVMLFGIVCQVPAAEPPPARIISLAPQVTEMLYALGLGERIVGVTAYCDYPSEAKQKPKVGGMSDPSLEAVVSLKPDIVVMTTDGNPKEFQRRLESLGIRTYVFKARRLSELPDAIREMGTALGADERASALAASMESVLKRPPRPPRKYSGLKVLFVVWPEPLIVAGPGTAIDDALALLGMRNIAHDSPTSYPKFSIEEIIRAEPDYIVFGGGMKEQKGLSLKLLKRLKRTPAVRNDKIFYVSDRLYRLGPRITEGIDELEELEALEGALSK